MEDDKTEVEETKEPSTVREAAEAAYESLAEEEATPPSEPEGEPQSQEIIEAPRSLSLEERTIFETLPTEAKKALVRLEDSSYRAQSKRWGEIGQHEKKVKDVLEAVDPDLEREWAKAGLTPGAVFKSYLAWETDYHQNPKEAIKQLLAAKNLTVADLDDQEEAFVSKDPRVDQLTQEIERLKGYVGSTEENAIAQQTNFIDNTIEQFRTQSGEDGKPIRPYFDVVYGHMLPIAKAYRDNNPTADYVDILDAAYRDACYVHPEVRKQVFEQEFKANESKKLQEKRDSAQRARYAGSSLNGAPSGGSVDNKPLSLREQIERNYDKLS